MIQMTVICHLDYVKGFPAGFLSVLSLSFSLFLMHLHEAMLLLTKALDGAPTHPE